jgi:hypothetical protein
MITHHADRLRVTSHVSRVQGDGTVFPAGGTVTAVDSATEQGWIWIRVRWEKLGRPLGISKWYRLTPSETVEAS